MTQPTGAGDGSRTTLPLTTPYFDAEERRLVDECLSSGWVTQGPLTQRFEALFAERHAVPHALATTSCTAALHLAAVALDWGPGDEVIVPAFTWVTSAHAAEYVGAKAVFADVDARTFNLDPAAFEAAITPRTKGVVVVHLFGLAAEMGPILEIANRHGIKVIEDAACAIGTRYEGAPVGGLGDVGCFSFHPRKVITTGEGGMMSTRHDDLAARLRSLRNHGATPPAQPGGPYTMGSFDTIGFNLRLSDIQAAVGVAQMAKLEGLLDVRLARARRYDELLDEVDDLATPFAPEGCSHTYQSYVVRLTNGGVARRNAVMDRLAELGVQTRPGTHAVHALGYYRQKYGVGIDDFPHARDAERLTITLPIFPGMADADQDRVVSALRDALARPTTAGRAA